MHSGFLKKYICFCRFDLPKIYTKLFDVTKPLKLWSVNDFHQQWVELNVPVDRIIDHLCKYIYIYIYIYMIQKSRFVFVIVNFF